MQKWTLFVEYYNETKQCYYQENGAEEGALYNWTSSAPGVSGGFFLQCFAASQHRNCPSGVVGSGPDLPCAVTIRDIGAVSKDNAIYTPFQSIDDYYFSVIMIFIKEMM